MKPTIGTIRKFKIPYDMASEGRVFYEKETYEAHYETWSGDQMKVVFYAENGYFNFTPELFERVITGWELTEVTE